MQDVLAEDDAVAAGPAEQDHVDGVHTCHEVFWAAVDVFKVVLLAAVAGKGGAEFEVDGEAREGDEHADYLGVWK